jgi:ubiquinone/menaquinone biosynthesis C-methylase UbiE
MGDNLQLLGITAIPRLARKYGIEVKLPPQRELYGLKPEEFGKVVEDAGKVLSKFFTEYKASWNDVYRASDIGMERMALAEEMKLNGDLVLDVGCGRGYFTFAAAKVAERVVGLDLMDGHGRYGWWRNFAEGMDEVGLSHRVLGVRADVRRLPFGESSFDAAIAVHSIRNFQDRAAIQKAIGEMKRVVVEGGRVIIAESLPVARNRAQEAHLQMFECKVRYTTGELRYLERDELVGMFEIAGFEGIETKELDLNLSAAPPFFHIDCHPLAGRNRGEAREAYGKAISLIREYGEASPPTILVMAQK